MMLDGSLHREPCAARRDRLQQEAVDLATVDEIHEHLAVVPATCDYGNETLAQAAQVLCQFLDVVADHRRIDDGHTDVVIANGFFRLLERIGVVHVVRTA